MTRFGYVMVAYVAAMATGLAALIHPHPRLIWNASASAPLGLYALHRTADPPVGVPLIKHVAATAGQRVCRIGDSVSIDAHTVASARLRDSRGRPLPVWAGCRTLRVGELFLLNAAVPDSLDGRYFGALPTSTVLGRATPLLTRSRPGAPLAWRGFQP